MNNPNETQVGGDHYRKIPGEQHWDRLVRMYGLDKAYVYFVGNATAYLERHRDKNTLPGGVLDYEAVIRDCEKAAHYARKLADLYRQERDKRLEEHRLNQRLQEVVSNVKLVDSTRPTGHGPFGALDCDTGDHRWAVPDPAIPDLIKCAYCGISKPEQG